MILADKIIQLRKKAGMSQEELAEKVGVSRQAVSKWESALATPDINKIISLSEVFGVSTDYLLKDTEEVPEAAPAENSSEEGIDEAGEKLHPVDLETANRFLEYNEKNAILVGIGVMLCIFSPAVFIVREGAAGAAFLIIMIGIAVTIFVSRGQISREFEWLKNEPLDTAYGVDGMVREKRRAYSPAHTRDMTIGIVLCVVSSLPLFLIRSFTEDPNGALIGVALILLFVGIGVFMIIKTATIWGGYQVLLEERGYSRQAKKVHHKIGGIYWGVATACYLLLSFLTGRWGMTWIVWPIAGVAYEIITQIMKA